MDLKNAEGMYESFFRRNPIPMWLRDNEYGTFVDVNHAAVARYGFSRDEFLAMTEDVLLPSTDHAERRAVPGRPEVVKHKTSSGRIIYVDVSEHEVSHEGRPAVLVSAVEITDLVEMEAAYAQSEERYRAISELTSDYAYAFHVAQDGTLTNSWSTGAYERMTGYDHEELKDIGGWQQIIDPQDRAAPVEQLGALIAGRPKTVEYRIITKNGSTRWMRDTARPRWDEVLQRTVDILGTITDITDEVDARHSMQRTLEVLHTILDSIDIMIYVADMDTYEILFANRTAREMLNHELTGQVCYRALRTAEEPCEFCTNPRLLGEDGEPVGVIVWEGRNPVTGRWLLNHDRAVRWPDGRIVRIQIATDITDRIDTEHQTQELQRQLQQSQKMEALGTLAGGIAHDFNNILVAILGFTDLAIADLGADHPVTGHLSEVAVAGRRASDLVRQILTFSRRTEPDMAPVELQSVVREAVNLLSSTLPATIKVHVDEPPDALVVRAEASQVHQVVVNLATNAAHAMLDEGGGLNISLNVVDSEDVRSASGASVIPGQYACMSVSDTGHGMDAEVIGRMFEPFFTTKSLGEGTGMGLAVVHGIVESHRGCVDVESAPGEGTTVRVYLPLVEQKGRAVAEARKVDLLTGTESILVVDDEPQVVEVLSAFLESAGYAVTSSTRPVEALRAFSAHPDRFDLVLTDLTMPDMTGDRLASRVRAERPGIPVILSTGHSAALPGVSAADNGITAVLHKPVTRAELLATVRRALDGAK